MAKKERDESAFVAEGEGARTDARAVCAGVGACVCVCPWILLGLAGPGWAAGLQKREERRKKMCRGLEALRLQVGRSRMARMCVGGHWVPVAEYGVLLAEFRRRGEVSVMADAGLVVYQTREWE